MPVLKTDIVPLQIGRKSHCSPDRTLLTKSPSSKAAQVQCLVPIAYLRISLKKKGAERQPLLIGFCLAFGYSVEKCYQNYRFNIDIVYLVDYFTIVSFEGLRILTTVEMNSSGDNVLGRRSSC